MSIRPNQPSAAPASAKSIAQKVEQMVGSKEGSEKAVHQALKEVLKESGLSGKARSELKLDAMKELKKKYPVLDKHFQHHAAPPQPTTASGAS